MEKESINQSIKILTKPQWNYDIQNHLVNGELLKDTFKQISLIRVKGTGKHIFKNKLYFWNIEKSQNQWYLITEDKFTLIKLNGEAYISEAKKI